MYISDYIGAGVKGHRNFDFVDVNLDDDTSLFIDPVLIELGSHTDLFCRRAFSAMTAFEDVLFQNMRGGSLLQSGLLAHAREVNAAKLGYGDGKNGKGKTELGLLASLNRLSVLTQQVDTINKLQDIPVLVKKFGEDNMSDLLLNVLHEQLNEFTRQEMERWNIPPTGQKEIWTFSAALCNWEQIVRPCWEYNGREILLIPKSIVRKRYLFCTDQYLKRVVIERMRQEHGREKWSKKEIMGLIPQYDKYWRYHHAVEYTMQHPDALTEYHNRLPNFYNVDYARMSDDDLDRAVYGYSVEELA